MPPMEQMDRTEKALLWEAQGHDRYGEPTVSEDYEEVLVRWEYTSAESVYPQQNTESIDALVVTDRMVAVGSVMWLGSTVEWAGSGSIPTTQVMRVTRCRKARDLKGRYTRFELALQRLKGSLPTQVG